jgi:SAM-dependent methyltransferase
VKPFADHFSRLAPEYAACRPHYPEALFDYLASLPSRRALAWDCAAGTGQATISLASRFEHVIATDISVPMLGQAPRHPRVEYRIAPADASGLADEAVDLVAVAQALHWLDTDRFYAEARRVLVPGGVLAVWTYGGQQVEDPRLQLELDRFHSQVVGPYWPPGRCHVEAGYRTLPFPFPELEPPPFIMEQCWTLAELLGYLRTWSASQRFREVVGHDPVDRFAQDLMPRWTDHSQRLRIRWPLHVRVGHRPHSV